MQLVQVRASLFGCFLHGTDTIQVYLSFSNAILRFAEHFAHDCVYLFKTPHTHTHHILHMLSSPFSRQQRLISHMLQ